MKKLMRLISLLSLLTLVFGCVPIPEAPSKIRKPAAPAVPTAPPLQQKMSASYADIVKLDLYPVVLSVLAGDGVDWITRDGVKTARVLQGVTMRMSAYVYMDNPYSTPEDFFGGRNIQAKFWGRIIEPPDVVEPGAETSFEQVLEYWDGPLLTMDVGGVHEGLRDTGLLADDTFMIPPEFDGPEWPSDLVVAEYGVDELHNANPAYADVILNEQLPRLRYLNGGGAKLLGINNHLMPRDEYAIGYRALIYEKPHEFSWIVYTFEVNTNALLDGFWEFGVDLDPNKEIEEQDEDNNSLTSNFKVNRPPEDYCPAIDTSWEEAWDETICNPVWHENMAVHWPEGFDTMLTRVNYRKSDGGYTEAPGWPFWARRDTAFSVRHDMYVTEFWGPEGSGRYYLDYAWHEYYDDSNPRPEADKIKNVFLFLTGNHGCVLPSIATGQTDIDCRFKQKGVYQKSYPVMPESWPGQLAMQWRLYREHYTPYDSLMAMAFQHEGQAATLEPTQSKIAEGFVDYLADRTNGFRGVTTVWLGGNSRGGAIAMHLAKIIQHRINVGAIDPPDDMQIIVTTADAVSVYDYDHLGYQEPVRIYNGSIWIDANGHNLEQAFPYSSDPAQDFTSNLHIRQTNGKSTGMDTLVHGWENDDWQDFVITDGLRGGFYTQDLDGFQRFISHADMCQKWMQVNAISNLEFFFRKAWDAKVAAYPDGCD